MAPSYAQPLLILDRFEYTPQKAMEAWRARGASPMPRPASSPSDGLMFFCPFDRLDEDRFYWDRDVSLDLSGHTSLEVELDCDVPSAFRSLAIYLQSGEGWFVWNRPLSRAGRQRLLLRRHEFAIEGKPAGWHRITRIRLSPWRGERRSATLRLYSMVARRDRLALVRGTISVPIEERAVAIAVAERIGRWLNAINVSYRRMDDDELSEEHLRDIQAIILPYNPQPPDSLLGVWKSFLNRGGKLLVFYGGDPRLAEAMGFRLGNWKAAPKPWQWASIRFVDSSAWGSLDRIYQSSGNILPVYPSAPETQVAALWEDDQGRDTGDPALVVGPQGAWLSHILLPGDSLNKQHFLAALLLRYAPDLAPEIADAALQTAGRIASFSGVGAALRALREAAPRSRDDRRIASLLADAEARYDRLRALRSEGRLRELLTESRRLRESLTEAYALAQSATAKEMRGVWDHQGVGWYPGDWDRTCREMKEAGLNTLFVNALWAGLAHYPSEVVPSSATFRMYGDQLAQCIAAARKYGLRVHLWYVCWHLGGSPTDWSQRMAAEGRLIIDGTGRSLPWLNPADPRNHDLALHTIREAGERYAVDGLHLDYIRWPETEADFSETTRKAFEFSIGARVRRWPEDVRRGGTRHDAWQDWRARVISDFVRQARESLRAVRPEAQLSAAVWGSYPDCIRSVGQDWGMWLQRGWVDFVTPMNYTENLNSFTSLLRRQLALPAAAGRVFPGIGVTASDSSLHADQVIEQIVAGRRQGAKGFVLFQMDTELRHRILPMLRLGVTAPLQE